MNADDLRAAVEQFIAADERMGVATSDEAIKQEAANIAAETKASAIQLRSEKRDAVIALLS